jgi:DNA-binding MarR family transcriptional regulator
MVPKSSHANLKILTSLIELKQWEWCNVPLLHTVIGRHVYFSLATELLDKPNEPGVRSLKQVLNHPGYTDRAIRMKLREMERMGFICSVHSDIDKRVRFVLPTPKFEQLVETHAKFYRALLEKEFILLEK